MGTHLGPCKLTQLSVGNAFLSIVCQATLKGQPTGLQPLSQVSATAAILRLRPWVSGKAHAAC